MATNNAKCGIDKNQRERFLRGHGFEMANSGKGSHGMWEHAEMKMLCRSRTIAPPANIVSSTEQKPWEVCLSDNPGTGLWHKIVKYAEWCESAVEDIKSRSEHDKRRCEVARQFREAVGQSQRWRQAVKHHFKAGLPRHEAPQPPITFEELQGLKAVKISLSAPAP